MAGDAYVLIVIFSALGGAYGLYAAAAILAGIAAWRRSRAAPAGRWAIAAAFCLGLAIAAHAVAVFVLPREFAGAITG